MEIEFYTEKGLLNEDDVYDALVGIARQAQDEGYINVMSFVGDWGTFVAFDEGEPIAYLSVSTWLTPGYEAWWMEDETAYIEQVVVSPEYRGCGIASSMYSLLEQAGVFSRLICSVDAGNEISQATHRSLGFEEVGTCGHYLVFAKDIA